MKEKIYIIFKNNEEEYDDYSDWIIEIYKDKEKAENRFVELVKTNQYKKDRAIKSAKYNEDIGAYRIEEHEIENETNKVIDTNVSDIEEDIKYIEDVIALAIALPTGEVKIQEEEIEAMQHILSDYKRVLKENETYKNQYFGLIDKIENKIDKFDYEFEKAKRKNDNDRANYYWDLIINFKKMLESEE